jgi:hypothetical protein
LTIWHDRLYEAIQEDDPPYIETLGDHWGDLCATEALASAWAEHLLPTLRSVLEAKRKGSCAFFSGTSLCYSVYEAATRLAWASPCDPKTLLRAARDHLAKQPAFAMECALAALHWMAQGHGHEISVLDVRQEQKFALQAAMGIGQSDRTQDRLQQLLASATQATRTEIRMSP